ncbi:hypothetical protein QJQ45_000486 [Haematococcus lacustris]|nr:hypothetical protein QJQ45_000486 [Haematococcus lacustris]
MPKAAKEPKEAKEVKPKKEKTPKEPKVKKAPAEKKPRKEKASGLLRGAYNKHYTSKKKDPNAPKRPMSSYMLWCQDNRDRIKTDNPDMKATEITSELGRQWKEVDEGAKKKYHEKAEAEKARYKTEMKDYKSKAGSEEDAGEAGEEEEEEDDDE